MVTVGDKMARHTEWVELAIRKHHLPLNGTESSNFGGAVGGGDGAPGLVDGLSKEVLRIEGDGKRAASVDDDRSSVIAGIIGRGALVSECRDEGRIEGGVTAAKGVRRERNRGGAWLEGSDFGSKDEGSR